MVSQDSKFLKLANEYIVGYLAWRPQMGTALGLHQYDGKLTDYSRSSIEAELRRLKDCQERLARLDTNGFSAPAFYDYRILRGKIAREIFGFEEMESFWRNPMTYADALDVNIYIKRDFAPLELRVQALTAILNQAPGLFAAARSNLSDALPRPYVETAIQQANGAADFLGGDLVAALKEVKNKKLMAEFAKANESAIAELRGFASWLKNEKLPKANNDYSLGREKYTRMLECGEMVRFSPEQLLDIGTRELRLNQHAFAEAAAVVHPGKKPVEVFQEIQKDHPSAANLIAQTAKDLEGLRQFVVGHQILTLPSPVRARVAETPQYLRAVSFASMDTPGPFESKATEAYYYVTPPEPGWSESKTEEWLTAFNYYTTELVSIHEAYPGHYVQFLCLKASPATRLEKMFGNYAFIEGWAHYAEQMMIEQGFGGAGKVLTTPEERVRAAKYVLAQRDEALLRVCRLCVSVKMHCQGMSVEEGTKFFEDNCYYAPEPARQEAVRGAYDPEYLYYTLGKLELLNLRADYQKQEGAHFSLRQFHDLVLAQGQPPVRLLRERLLKDPNLWDQVLPSEASRR